MSENAHSQDQNSRLSDFSSRFQEALKATGTSPVELAKALNIAHSSVYRWLEGATPRIDKVEKIAQILRVNANWLLTGTGNLPTQESEDKTELYRKMVIELMAKTKTYDEIAEEFDRYKAEGNLEVAKALLDAMHLRVELMKGKKA